MEFEHALDVMLEYGCEGAELRSLWGTNISDLSDEQMARAKAALDARGMTVSCIASPMYKCDLYGETGDAAGNTHQATARNMDEQLALMDRCIRAAKFFGTPFIRIFAFWKRGDLTDNIEADIIRVFREHVGKAESEGVILGLENEHACWLGTGAQIARVIEAVGSPALKAVWDPGNAFMAGELPYPDGYKACKNDVVHVHVKDAVRDADGARFLCIGDGVIDFSGQFDSLKADGYDGFISLETHWKPGGVAEDGSRQCLAALNKLLAGM
jgi:sugar phosphate isomerase/epimerase